MDDTQTLNINFKTEASNALLHIIFHFHPSCLVRCDPTSVALPQLLGSAHLGTGCPKRASVHMWRDGTC